MHLRSEEILVMSTLYWACGDEVAPIAAGFVHRGQVRLDRSPEGVGLFGSNAFFGQIVGSPPDFDENQFIFIEGDDVNFTTTNLVISSDNGIAQIQEIIRRPLFCRAAQ